MEGEEASYEGSPNRKDNPAGKAQNESIRF